MAAGVRFRPRAASTIVPPERKASFWKPTDLIQVMDFSGEPDRIRTCDPLIKSQLLYQLSYRPHVGGD